MATTWKQLEPTGFGTMPFGDPSSGVDPDTGEDIKIFTIHSSGFGDPKTKWTDADEA